MSWTKRQLIEQAFEEIGMAAYVFDLTPEQMQSAMRRMDAMVSTWMSKNILLGYPVPVNPQNADLDESSNIPDTAVDAVYQNLAIRLAPGFGKAVSMDLKASAKTAYDSLLMTAAFPNEMQYDSSLPLGAGNKPTMIDRVFVSTPDDGAIQVDSNGQLIFAGD